MATERSSAARTHALKALAFLIGGATIALSSFALGRITTPQPTLEARVQTPRLIPVQDQQAPGLGQQQTPQELIPLPGPGQQTPGQQPGPPVPGQGQGKCPVYIYQDGRLFQFPAPGQQPGQQPGQGNGPGPGTPGGPQELIPLDPGGGSGGGGNPGNPTPNLPPNLPQQPTPPAPNNRS